MEVAKFSLKVSGQCAQNKMSNLQKTFPTGFPNQKRLFKFNNDLVDYRFLDGLRMKTRLALNNNPMPATRNSALINRLNVPLNNTRPTIENEIPDQKLTLR